MSAYRRILLATDLSDDSLSVARRAQALATEIGIPEERCSVEAGNIKAEIVRGARERHADLIVVASRERHGPSIFLNLTEDTVLHAAPCDVLAMRIGR